MPPKLSEKENESIRDFVKHHLVPRFGSQSSVARNIGSPVNSFADFMVGARGGSVNMAGKLGALVHVSGDEVLGRKPRTANPLQPLYMVPEYEPAYRVAKKLFPHIEADTWNFLKTMHSDQWITFTPLDATTLGILAHTVQSLRKD